MKRTGMGSGSIGSKGFHCGLENPEEEERYSNKAEDETTSWILRSRNWKRSTYFSTLEKNQDLEVQGSIKRDDEWG